MSTFCMLRCIHTTLPSNTEYLFTWISLRHLGNHIGGHVSLPCPSSVQPSFCVFFTRYRTSCPFTLAGGETNRLRIYNVFFFSRESIDNENCPTNDHNKTIRCCIFVGCMKRLPVELLLSYIYIYLTALTIHGAVWIPFDANSGTRTQHTVHTYIIKCHSSADYDTL